MSRLDESDRVTSREMEAALAAYGAAFPDDGADWLHPALIGTRQLHDALWQAMRERKPLSVATVEERFGPLSWDW